MGTEENKDLLNVGGHVLDSTSAAATPIVKKRTCIAAGTGAGMLIAVWINKKIKVTGGGICRCR
ncbi:hypothetical protein MKW94_019668 [Papaver nudicaule]|uniref:Uncharacterized protein n=1 Tax=Papaver nudicaule TaxID=74823 RepID=A0AA41VHE7_PAPNU|nr:hypothetical protein [Papaver nudicaule]